ncbi:MAG: hypothetical protein Q9187_009738 [Circinaria calcarea]
MAVRDTLNQEERERLDSEVLALQKKLLETIERRKAIKAALPQVLPPPKNNEFDRKAKSHDKTTKRSMLGVEIAEKEADKAEKEAAKKECIRKDKTKTQIVSDVKSSTSGGDSEDDKPILIEDDEI